MRLVAYCRLSPRGEDDAGLGLKAQRSAIASWARAHGHRVVKWRVDRDVSGAAELKDRPRLLRALYDVTTADALIVAKRDRLSRDVDVCGGIALELRRHGARVISADCANGETPEDKLLERILDAAAEFERARTITRIRETMKAKRQRGEALGNVPLGFRAVGPRKRRVLEVDPDEEQTIWRIRQLRAAGLGAFAIASRLNKEGRPARGTRWYAGTVTRFLASGRS